MNLKILKVHFQIHYCGPFGSVKYLHFSQEAIKWESSLYHFSKLDTLRLLRNSILFCLPAGAKYLFFFSLQLMDYIGDWKKFYANPVCFFITFLVTKICFESPFDLYFHLFLIEVLLNSYLNSYSSKSKKRYTLMLICWSCI